MKSMRKTTIALVSCFFRNFAWKFLPPIAGSDFITKNALFLKEFNTAGTCRPNVHYMVDITERLEIIRKIFPHLSATCHQWNRQLPH